jgi:uroporphyrinogen-III decarboxylase
VWICDDMAYNEGPMFSPRSFEQVFLPACRRMFREFKSAGSRWVLLHSDGNILPILDMLVDAGIDGLNPLEKRAGMCAALIRRRYPRLILTGGMCNTHTLVHGPARRVEAEARELIDLGQEGELVIGTHSIGPEIPLEFCEAYHHACQTYGNYHQRPAVSQSARREISVATPTGSHDNQERRVDTSNPSRGQIDERGTR